MKSSTAVIRWTFNPTENNRQICFINRRLKLKGNIITWMEDESGSDEGEIKDVPRVHSLGE